MKHLMVDLATLPVYGYSIYVSPVFFGVGGSVYNNQKNRCHTCNQISTLRPGYCTIINIKSVVTY